MKFFGCGIVWDKDEERELCRFSKTGLRKGELVTNDESLIDKLKELGYEYQITEEDLQREREKLKGNKPTEKKKGD